MTLARTLFSAMRGRRAIRAAAISGLALLAYMAEPSLAQERRAGFIVWNLPPKDSEVYRRLRDLAGVAEGKTLTKTGAEMWSVEPGRVSELRRASSEQGVQISEIDDQPSALVTSMAGRVENDETPPPQTRMPMIQRAMRSDAVTSVTMLSLKPAPVMEYALMRPSMPNIAAESKAEVVLQLEAGVIVHARRTHMEAQGSKVFWYGRTVDEGLPVSLMWAPDGRFAGTLKHGSKEYVIKTAEGGLHIVIAMEDDMMPPEHPDSAAFRPHAPLPGAPRDTTIRIDRTGEDRRNLEDAPENMAAAPATPELVAPALLNTSRPIEITVLFAYTPAAASHYRDIRMELIDLAVEQGNQSFRSSGIGNVRLAVAGTYQVDYDEGQGGIFDHLWNLADRNDGHMDEIHQVRDKMRADVVVLIVDSPDACGLATRVNADADEAFAVVHHICAMTSYSIPHEIGHLLGGRHDRAIDDTSRPFPFGHGFVNGSKWRTIMAYKSSCNGCPRLPIWSNPNILIEGEPAGDTLTYDARVVSEQAARVAAFR